MDAHVARRTLETGLPDPLPLQPIPLRQIGQLATAVPGDKKLLDKKLPSGDFIGYDRDKKTDTK